MSHTEFTHLLRSIDALSPEQMRQLSHELEVKLAAATDPHPVHGLGSLGAMRDAADELDEAVAYAMQLRQRPWRLPDQRLGYPLNLTNWR